ncbi:MAG TPA: hypothetical protein DIT59_03825 [Leclercia sp.]|nr:hypothetical protein [Leclercia sp.]
MPGGATLTGPTQSICRSGKAKPPPGKNPARVRAIATRLFYGEIKEKTSREKAEIPNKCGDLQNRIAENNILPAPHVISLHRPTSGKNNKE